MSAPAGRPSYTVADYLMDRLVELNVDQVFGVPGDFTLSLLDHIVAHRAVAWTGCTNELNAGYAADGYGRMRGIAALCTTFGVGELSAINALAGSFAEHVPVVEIVGSPATAAQSAHRIVHHSLGDGVFTHFMDMHENITCARAALAAETATAEIDRVLTAVRDQRLPGYLLIPADVAEAPVHPPTSPLAPATDVTDAGVLAAFAEAASRLLNSANDNADVTVLAGLLVHRLGAAAQLANLISAGPLRHATSLWGKSLVDESDPHYLGIYAGAASDEVVRLAVEDAPVLVLAGVQFTDLNSGFFTQQITRERTIELSAAAASVGAALFQPLALPDALRVLTQLIADAPGHRPLPTDGAPEPAAAYPDPSTPLSQAMLWDAVAGQLRTGDIVVADQGTSFYGMANHRLPRDVTFLGQPLWASIGYSLPALLGACLAAPGRRGVLLIGDGAAQMTLQELGTVIRHGLTPLVVVVDNDGYTVERAIHGPEEPYNDIAGFDWAALPAVLGPDRPLTTAKAQTAGELRDVLAAANADPVTLSLVQAVLARDDVPELLRTLARAAAAANTRPPTPAA